MAYRRIETSDFTDFTSADSIMLTGRDHRAPDDAASCSRVTASLN
ncbi:MAG: hypothetical protein ACRD2I_19065 [Vicinamibacterales bacterium]